jgi:hypothetical protein
VIFTDEHGRPIPGAPDPLEEGATLEERIAHARAVYAYRDRIADVTNRAFARAFRKALSKIDRE